MCAKPQQVSAAATDLSIAFLRATRESVNLHPPPLSLVRRKEQKFLFCKKKPLANTVQLEWNLHKQEAAAFKKECWNKILSAVKVRKWSRCTLTAQWQKSKMSSKAVISDWSKVCCHQSRQLKPLITSHSHSFWLVGWCLPASQTSHSPAKNQSFLHAALVLV